MCTRTSRRPGCSLPARAFEVQDASENAGLVEKGFEFGGKRCLSSDERFGVRNVAIDLKYGVIAEQLHPAVHNDFAAILADMSQLSGPVTSLSKLRAQLDKFDRKFGLQQRVAAAPDRLVR